jgi:hypothetical protein
MGAIKMQFSEWTKKLGQQCWSDPDTHTTFCGKPQLGNNYADLIKDEFKTPCKTCLDIIDARYVDTNKLENNLKKAGLNVIVFD